MSEDGIYAFLKAKSAVENQRSGSLADLALQQQMMSSAQEMDLKNRQFQLQQDIKNKISGLDMSDPKNLRTVGNYMVSSGNHAAGAPYLTRAAELEKLAENKRQIADFAGTPSIPDPRNTVDTSIENQGNVDPYAGSYPDRPGKPGIMDSFKSSTNPLVRQRADQYSQMLQSGNIRDPAEVNGWVNQLSSLESQYLSKQEAFANQKTLIGMRPGMALNNTNVNDSLAQSIYEGRSPAITGRALLYPAGQALMSRVNEIADEKGSPYDATSYSNKQQTLNAFTKGVEGRSTRAFNVALNHMDTLEPIIDALNNGDLKVLNALGNRWNKETGQGAILSFEAARTIVANEVVKSIVGGQSAVHDRQVASDAINSATSPAKLKEVLNTYRDLMTGQLDGLRQQYESSGRSDFNQRFLTGASKRLITSNGGQPEAGNVTQPSQQGIPTQRTNVMNVKSEAEYNLLPSGASYAGTDGKVRVKQ